MEGSHPMTTRLPEILGTQSKKNMKIISKSGPSLKKKPIANHHFLPKKWEGYPTQ